MNTPPTQKVGTRSLTLSRHDAVNVVALLTAQLANTTLAGHSNGACPSFRAGGKQYSVVVNSNGMELSKEEPLSEFETVLVLRDIDATGLVIDLVRLLSNTSPNPHSTTIGRKQFIFNVEP